MLSVREDGWKRLSRIYIGQQVYLFIGFRDTRSLPDASPSARGCHHGIMPNKTSNLNSQDMIVAILLSSKIHTRMVENL